MQLQDTLTKEVKETLRELQRTLRAKKARDLFHKLRLRVKRDNMVMVSYRGKIKKILYGGIWHRPVIINDKLYLISRGKSIEYLS